MLGEIILVLLIIAIISILPHGIFKKVDVRETEQKPLLSPQQLQKTVQLNRRHTQGEEVVQAEKSVQLTQNDINELGEDITSILDKYI